MTGSELYEARRALGELWGLGRALTPRELGRVLRLAGRDPGHSISDYERGRSRISGPLSVAVEMMLQGALPPDSLTEDTLEATVPDDRSHWSVEGPTAGA